MAKELGRFGVSSFKVSFDDLEWQQIRPDVRQKLCVEGSQQIRLVEFQTSDCPEHWCETGHVGYVLSGALSISFDGEVVSFKAGDGLLIPPGAASKHRAVAITPGTRLLMVEDP